MSTARVRRLVMIESGKIRYADLGFADSVHIFAPNNRGKTSLISALRFLFIANVRDMGIPEKTVEETKEYFFRSEFSTMAFECESRTGKIVTVLVRSEGLLGRYDFQRFVYQGPFERSDYIDEHDTPRVFADVKRRLAPRHLTALEKDGGLESVVTNAGTSAALDAGLGIGLVPLRNAGDYKRFVLLFRQLLQLGTLDQAGLKNIFMTINRAKLKTSPDGVELRAMSADHFDREASLRAEIKTLKEVEPDAHRLKESLFQYQRGRAHLPAMFNRLMALREERLLQLDADDKHLDAVIRARVEEQKAARNSVGSLAMQIKNLDESIAGNKRLIDEHRKTGEEKQYPQFLEEMEKQAITEMEGRAAALHQRVAGAEQESPDVLRVQLDNKKGLIESKKDQLANIRSLVGTHLSERVDAAVLGSAFSVLDPSLLRLKVGTDVEFSEPTALDAALRRAAEVARGNDDSLGIRFAPGCRRAADTGAAVSAETLQDEVNGLQAEINTLSDRLKDATNIAPLKASLQEVNAKLQEARTRMALYQDWVRKSQDDVPRWSQEVRSYQLAQKPIQKAHDDLIKRINELDQLNSKDGLRLGEIRVEHGQLSGKRLRGAEQDWLRHTDVGAVSFAAETDFFSLFERYDDLYGKMDAARVEFEKLVGSIGQRLPDVAHGATPEESAQALVEAVATIEQKVSTHAKTVQDIVTAVRRSVMDTIESIRQLTDEVKLFSQRLSKVPISDLQSVGIDVVENAEEVAKLNDMLSVSADDLFGVEDPAALDRMKKRIEHQPRLMLSDLFGLQFRVEKVDGSKLLLKDIARVESNGTTVAVKVLVCMLLLREFMSSKHRLAMPYYLDEVSALDEGNLRRILEKAKELGFVSLLASPQAGAVADVLYYLDQTEGGLSVLDEGQRIERIVLEAA